MWAVPRIWEFYPGICLTTEEKTWKNLSQGSQRVVVYILHITKIHTLQNTHTHTHTHTLRNPHTHLHIKKQYKTTTVQIKTNTVQNIPK